MVPGDVRSNHVRFGSLMVRAALAGLFLASAAGCASEPKKEGPAEVRASIDAANKQFMDAFSRRDAVAIGLLYAESAQVLPPGAPTLEGREAIVNMWQSVLALPFSAFQLQTVDIGVGDDTAWEVGRYTMTGTNGKVAEAGKYIVIWKHDEAGWKLYRDMWSSNTPAAAPATR